VNAPDAPGSRIEARSPQPGPLGIAHRSTLARYVETLSLGRDQGAQLVELLRALVDAGHEPYRATFSGRAFEVLLPDDERLCAFAAARAPCATLERGLASFAIVGRELTLDASLPARVQSLCRRAELATIPALGGPSSSSLVILTPAETLTAAVRTVHAGLFGATVGGDDVLVPHPPAETRVTRA
jgi:hypothetical protein